MELDGRLFVSDMHWLFAAIWILVMYLALRLAPWSRLRDPRQFNAFLGALVALMLLWHLRADVQPGISFHLLGVTALTLMFGWSLAVIGSSLVLAAVILNGHFGWTSFFVGALVTGVVPVTLSQIWAVLIRSRLPHNFFVFVLVSGFLTAGFVGVASGYLAVGLLISSGAYTLAELNQTFLPFFPLMFLPEAIVNGWVITMLVAFRPEWVGAFSDELYLKGK